MPDFCAEVSGDAGPTCPFESLTARPGAVRVDNLMRTSSPWACRIWRDVFVTKPSHVESFSDHL